MSLTQLLKNRDASDVIPALEFGKFGLSHFFEFRCYGRHGVTNDGCSIGVYHGLSWDLTADRFLYKWIARITDERIT